MTVWIEAGEFHLVIGLSSLFSPGLTQYLRKLAERLVHLARLEGRAGVGKAWSAEPASQQVWILHIHL